MFNIKIEPAIIISIIGLCGTVLGYVFGKKERITKIKGSELDNVEHGLKIYKDIMETLELNLKAALDRLDSAQMDYVRLKEQLLLIEVKEAQCQDEKKQLIEENISFYRTIQTCPETCEKFKKNKNDN